MLHDFVVYPTKGFLNTEFIIKSEQSVDYSIFYKGVFFHKGVLTKGVLQKLPRFAKSGEYTILSIIGGEEVRKTIHVEDAQRLGSSELKNAYVFDDFQYIVFVMKDRIHFYDPSLNTFVYTENFLSPQYIYCVNSQLLLFVTEHSEGTSISLFDADSFSIQETIECDFIAAHNPDISLLFIKNNNRVIRLDTRNHLTEICHYDIENNEKESCWVDEELKILYIVTKQLIHCVDLNSGEEKKHELQDAIGITKNGYIIYCTGRSTYKYKCVLPDCEHERKFTYSNAFNSVEFDGHSLDDEKWKKHNDYGFETYFEAVKDKLKEELRCGTNEKKKNNCKSISAFDCSAKLDFYPCINGVYIIERVSWRNYTSVNYSSSSDLLYHSSQTNNEAYLLWIGNDSFHVKYKTSVSALTVKDNKASFAINETTSALLESGIVKYTYEGALTALKEITDKTEETEDEIIVDGEKVSSSYIQCKDAHKLLLKRGNLYSLYELNDKNIWILQNDIQLIEQRYERVALSPDGKYVLYSRGRNQYALYNIETQKEETIKTGNFVDFDKEGNYIVADKKRQLRIYNPKTFECVKDCPEFYTFVSPDGKLYAKTSLKTKIINRITNNEITREEYNSFKNQYDYSSWKDADSKKPKRKQFIEQNQDFFNEQLEKCDNIIAKTNVKTRWLSMNDFSYVVFKEKQYVRIGISGTTKEIEIGLDFSLDYLNYVSFSYDNNYVAIVGKPGSRGYLKLVKIAFDTDCNKLCVIDNICDMIIAEKATWTCAFNQKGLFGTYDSIPNMYIIDKDGYAKFNNDNSHDFSFLRKNFCIPNRSLMCFSNSGKYMALSVQGYEPISLGGKGHLPSNKMYIHSTENGCHLLDEWDYQGQAVSKLSPYDPYKKNLVQAGFSANDDKIMTVSGDGVIVIRNLHLEEPMSDK